MIVVNICHGVQGDILLPVDVDEEDALEDGVPVKEIEEKFHRMSSMIGRPKILIIEACRGDRFNSGKLVDMKHSKFKFKQTQSLRSDVSKCYFTLIIKDKLLGKKLFGQFRKTNDPP